MNELKRAKRFSIKGKCVREKKNPNSLKRFT